MDRRLLQERLDAVRPGSDDLSLPEMSQVRQALKEHPELALEVARRQRFDARVRGAMFDVPVPEGLEQRILSVLAQEWSQTSEKLPRPATSSVPVTRRQALAWGGALAASVLAAGVYWSTNSQTPETIPLADLQDTAAQLLAGTIERVPFQGSFTPRPPAGRWNRLQFDQREYGLFPSPKGHRAIAWGFTWNQSRGVLINIPRGFVSSAPDATRDYTGGGTVAWSEQDFVYVCRVDGQIDQLLRQLDGGRLA